MKPGIKTSVVVGIFVAVLALFVEACITALSDAQGAIAFVVVVPIFGVLFWIGFLFSRGQRIRGLLWAELSFIALFYVSSFVPPLAFFPKSVMGVVGKGFESVRGMSPYAWERRKSEAAVEKDH